MLIIAIILSLAVLVGIALMSRVKTAVAGNLLSAAAMLCGIVATICYNHIASAWTIYAGIIAGALAGGLMATRAKMIQMPQLVALFNGLGGGASALVGILSYMGIGQATDTTPYPHFVSFTALLAIAVGMITLVGSLVAAGKLHRLLPQRPVVYPAHSAITLTMLFATVVFIVVGTLFAQQWWVALVATLVAGAFGYMFAIRVGGADMPITISLLNSLSGVAGAIAGMAIGDIFLVAVGGIVGASGLLLTQIMCRAMNRQLLSILLAKTTKKVEKREQKNLTGETPNIGQKPSSTTLQPTDEHKHLTDDFEQLIENLNDMEAQQLLDAIEALTREIAGLRQQLAQTQITSATSADTQPAETEPAKPTAASVLAAAKDVIIVPGYGMALAGAQHIVKQLADRLESKGARVRYAIHPVAGRMPGHMNVLLAEADIPYEQLYEMDAINNDFKTTDAVVVVGANDVLNPAARNAEGTPIYGMPVLAVDEAKEVIVCNYDLKPGYAGVENPLYKRDSGVYLCLGDAKTTLMQLIAEI